MLLTVVIVLFSITVLLSVIASSLLMLPHSKKIESFIKALEGGFAESVLLKVEWVLSLLSSLVVLGYDLYLYKVGPLYTTVYTLVIIWVCCRLLLNLFQCVLTLSMAPLCHGNRTVLSQTELLSCIRPSLQVILSLQGLVGFTLFTVIGAYLHNPLWGFMHLILVFQSIYLELTIWYPLCARNMNDVNRTLTAAGDTKVQGREFF